MKPAARPNRFTNASKKLSARALVEVETLLGFEVPEALAAHYTVKNGGTPARKYFRTKDGTEYTVDRFLAMKHREDDDEELVEDAYRTMVVEKKIFPPHLLPVAEDEGGGYYCFHRKTGAIHFVSPDHYDDMKKALSKVAASLDEFIQGMLTEEEFYAEEDDD